MNVLAVVWRFFQTAAMFAGRDMCEYVSGCLHCPVRGGCGPRKMADARSYCAEPATLRGKRLPGISDSGHRSMRGALHK